MNQGCRRRTVDPVLRSTGESAGSGSTVAAQRGAITAGQFAGLV